LPSSINTTGACPNPIPKGDEALWAEQGCFNVETGNMVGPTKKGVEDIVALDPNAHWVGPNDSTGYIDDSDFDPVTSSPRVVPIGVIDIDQYLGAAPNGSGGIVRLTNIFGFFVDGMGDWNPDGTFTLKAGGKSVIGHIMKVPGMGQSKLTTISTFLNTVILVR
jgi:hypothetical protein